MPVLAGRLVLLLTEEAYLVDHSCSIIHDWILKWLITLNFRRRIPVEVFSEFGIIEQKENTKSYIHMDFFIQKKLLLRMLLRSGFDVGHKFEQKVQFGRTNYETSGLPVTDTWDKVFRITMIIQQVAGHHRHIFCPLTLLKISFKKYESVFFKKMLSSANFDNFSKLNIFLICAKHPQFR